MKPPLVRLLLTAGLLTAGCTLFATAEVTSTSPVDGAIGVALDATVTVSFSADMDQARTEAAFIVLPSIAGTFNWPTARQLVFTPATGLTAAATYTVTVTSDATTSAGTRLTGYEFTFSTGN